MHDFDVIVIGGGLLGCFVARNLAKYRLKIAIFEEREDLCTGISRANTAIVYSGCDTRPGTLKSRMCVKAAQSFDSLCSELGVRYKQCGSIMVCFGPKGEEVLHKKLAQGLENGVRGLKLLERKEVLALEPGLSSDVRLGLYAPEAGTVLPWELGLAAAENAASNGVEIKLNTKVTDIKRTEHGYTVHTGAGYFCSQGVINCAGMFADEILEKVQNPLVRIIPDSGDYLILDTKTDGYIIIQVDDSLNDIVELKKRKFKKEREQFELEFSGKRVSYPNNLKEEFSTPEVLAHAAIFGVGNELNNLQMLFTED